MARTAVLAVDSTRRPCLRFIIHLIDIWRLTSRALLLLVGVVTCKCYQNTLEKKMFDVRLK
jgi:hypothetical protein